jgi:hypothetical protein
VADGRIGSKCTLPDTGEYGQPNQTFDEEKEKPG